MIMIDEFSALLKRKMGLDSGSIGKAAVERAVRHRMNAVGVADEHEFLRRLHTAADEMQQLIETVIVPETWFFRYPESQTAMASLARARLFAAGVPESRVLRILSVPCASGEEPYSIAMALLDAGVPAARFQVDAVDISERMVQFAQRAVYGRNAFRGDDLAYRDRHFVETADGHQLNAQVREQVRFQHGNLFDGNLLAGVAPYDFVFCRNLLIYFDGPTQERAVQVLRGFTRNDGVIFVGPAETSLLTQRRLPALPLARSFAFQAQALPAPPEPAMRAMGAMGVAGATPIVHAWSPPRRPVPQAPAARLPLAHAAIAPAPGNGDLSAATGNISAPTDHTSATASLRQIAQMADRGRVQDALAQCRAHIDLHGVSADALHLLGLLQDAAGDMHQAQAAYRKALYLDPTHREALLHLAALVASSGDIEGARRLQARAARQEARRD
ncbi:MULTISPECIES: CheR family methyltransferase [Achromobacter]|uniref:CheR family methyltransferase n=1 Tax=Achromobacter spanius TaxID=217203 RepID=A0ABY8GXQ4_9BURK|nr:MULTISPECIES: CheR family methyltransferase [Achromobacter]WAI81106.1 chemotaxis protein CheR [Achromobacter spanius]WEX96624.1 chemotaxis protein CheR [Achromobacter sp. SS2-2022]WFP09660.1 CheR family methyltransferase [Achromobacter spanius]